MYSKTFYPIVSPNANSSDRSSRGCSIGADDLAGVAIDRTIPIMVAFESIEFCQTSMTRGNAATDKLRPKMGKLVKKSVESLYTIHH